MSCVTLHSMDKVMTITFTDSFEVNTASKRVYDDMTGFLRVPGRVARTGVQTYLRSELGLDGNPLEKVNVFRSPEEVFADGYLKSFKDADITNDHHMVDADSFKSVSVGHSTSEGYKDPEDDSFVICDLIIKDKDVIQKIESGKVELSTGYTAEYVPSKGVYNGIQYDFEQKNLKVNHVAIVDRARAGRQAKIFDSKGVAMSYQVMFDGESITVDSESTQKLIQKAFDSKQAEVLALMDAEMEAKKKADKMEAQKDEKEEELKKEKMAKDAALEELGVYKRNELIASIQSMDSEFACDADSELEIKRAFLTKTRDTDMSEKSEAYIDAAFDLALESKAKVEAKAEAVADSLENFGSIGEVTEDSANDGYLAFLRGEQ